MLQDKAQGYVWNKTEDTVYIYIYISFFPLLSATFTYESVSYLTLHKKHDTFVVYLFQTPQDFS